LEYIKLEDIWKTYKTKGVTVTPLRGLSMSVDKGELVVVLGPSGEGKTTLLRVIAGLLRQDKGHVYLRGELVDDLPPRERNVAMVFQSYAIYPFMSVYDNIAFPLKLMHRPKQEIDAQVKKVAEMLRIGDILSKKPSELSGGQRQRVAIAKALVKGADILLMDEPMANLDAIVRVYAREELKQLHKELGTTIVYVTHDQVEALSLATKLAVLHDGVIQDFGDPMEVYRRPRNTWVASFVGNPPMNVLEGTVREGYIVSKKGELKLPLPSSYRGSVKEGQDVTFGFRPEDAVVGEGDLRGVVSMIERVGAYTVVHVDVGDGTLLRILYPSTMQVNRGDKVSFTVRPGSLVLFDPATGKRVEAASS
jgi:multiple sugar transport system ATP-binding protein